MSLDDNVQGWGRIQRLEEAVDLCGWPMRERLARGRKRPTIPKPNPTLRIFRCWAFSWSSQSLLTVSSIIPLSQPIMTPTSCPPASTRQTSWPDSFFVKRSLDDKNVALEPAAVSSFSRRMMLYGSSLSCSGSIARSISDRCRVQTTFIIKIYPLPERIPASRMRV